MTYYFFVSQLILFFSATSGASIFDFWSYQVVNEWKQVDFQFSSNSEREEMIKSKTFVPENNIPTAIKIFGNRMFVTTPRYWSGVPSTLNVIKYSPSWFLHIASSPKFTPFPSWAMQKEGDCSALQLVESMEIDQFGRLWIVDLGRTSVLEEKPNNLCPAKLVVLDLKNKDRVVMTYSFPPDVVSPTENLLKDINVACTNEKECFAYIADLSGRLIVFNMLTQTSWALFHSTMLPDPQKINFTIHGRDESIPFGIAGSALSPKRRNFTTFYYTAIAGTSIHTVPTWILNAPPKSRNLTDDQVKTIGERNGQSDGWAMDNEGNIYYGSLTQDAVYQVQTTENPPAVQQQKLTKQSKSELIWPDTFGFDNHGALAVSSTKFNFWEGKQLNWNEINFRVVRFWTGTKAYSA